MTRSDLLFGKDHPGQLSWEEREARYDAAGLGLCCWPGLMLLSSGAPPPGASWKKGESTQGRRAILGVFVPRAVCFICGPLVHEAQIRAAKGVLKCVLFLNGLHCVLPLFKKMLFNAI